MTSLLSPGEVGIQYHLAVNCAELLKIIDVLFRCLIVMYIFFPIGLSPISTRLTMGEALPSLTR